MRDFFKNFRRLSHGELEELAKFSGGVAALVLVVMVFSGSLPGIPNALRLALSFISRSANTADVVNWNAAGTYTWTDPAVGQSGSVTQAYITVVGGGGGGASQTASPGCGDYGSGGGGGSGGYVHNQLVSVTPGHTYTITVGGGGAGGPNPGCNGTYNNGGSGGGSSVVDQNTSITVLSATGGQGGQGGTGGQGGSPGGVAGANGIYYYNYSQAGGSNGSGFGSGGNSGSGSGQNGQAGYVSIITGTVLLTATPQTMAPGNVGSLTWAYSGSLVATCKITDQYNNVLLQQASVSKQTFSYSGGDQSYTVPADVTQLMVKLWGAAGGGGNDGAGGFTSGLLAVSGGQVVTVIVGQGGGAYNAYGGGGGGSGTSGGGGRSAVRISGVELMTAGGGGGSYYSYGTPGAGGGLSGQDGDPTYGGTGGTQTTGGIGNATYNPGNNGSQFTGSPGPWHAGGGGGWYGGGAGIAGGGGSGYCGGAGVSSCTTTAGNRTTPAGTSDPDYVAGVGTPDGHSGYAVIYPTARTSSGTVSTGVLSSSNTYTLSCTDLQGNTFSTSASVTVASNPVVTLSASPANVASNGTSTLTWSSSSVTPNSCSIAASPASTGSGSNNPTTFTNTSATLPAGAPEGVNQPLVIGNYIYRFGGYDGANYTTVISRAPLSNPTSWSNVGNMPASSYAATQFVIGNTIYSFGGINSTGTAWTNGIYTAPTSNPTSWTSQGSLPAAAPASASNATIVGDTIYFFGGISSATNNWTDAIYAAPVSNPTAWAQVGTLPSGAPDGVGGSAVIVGSYIYKFGGASTDIGNTNVIWRAPLYSPTSWSNTGATLPGILAYAPPAIVGNTIYLLGGHNGSVWTGTIYTAPVSNPLSWSTSAATVPITPGLSSPVIIDNKLYIFGGLLSNTWYNGIYSAPVNTGLPLTSLGQPSWLIDGGNNTAVTWPLTQSTTYTLMCRSGDAGLLLGSPTTGVSGKFGQAVTFGSNDVMLPYSIIPLASGTWTISTWFMTPLPATTNGGWRTLTRGSGGDHEVIVDSSGNLGTYDNIGGTAFHSSGYNLSGLSAGWHHLAAVGSGASTAFYIDGSSVGSATYKSTANIYSVGNYAGGGQQFGTIDDFRVYNRALSPSEITTLYTGGSVTNGLEAYWTFDTGDLSVPTVYDSSAAPSQTSVTVTAGTPPPALTLSASTPVNAGQSSTLTWTSSNINAGSCSVIQIDPSSVVSNVYGMGSNDNGTNKSGPALSQAGSYTYKLACAAPYTAGNNGTLVGSPTTGVTGQLGQAVTFNGSSQYITLGTPSALEGLQVPVTISGWFKQTSASPTNQPVYAGYQNTSGSQLWSLVRIDNGILKYYTTTSSGGYQSLGSFAPTVGSWHFFTVVVSGTTAAPTVTIYLDGQAPQSGTLAALSSNPNLSVPIYIGGDAAYAGERFNGSIDDVRVYNRALSSDEVSTLFGGGQVTTGLVGYWPLDTNTLSGTTAYDEAGGVTTKTASVTVNSALPPSTITLAASRVRSGNAATLTWNVQGGIPAGNACYLTPAAKLAGNNTGAVLAATGSTTTVPITAATTYTFTCGNGTASTTVSTNATLVPQVQEI